MTDFILTNEELREKLRAKGVDFENLEKYPDEGNCLKLIKDFLDCVDEAQAQQNAESSDGASVSILNTARRRIDQKKEFPPGSGNWYDVNSVTRTIGYSEKTEVTDFLPTIRN